jgi:Kef-type K+ transport system membrane component KefB
VGYYKARGWTSQCVVYVAEFSEVFGILIFGMAFAIYHPPQDILGFRLDAVHWYVIQIVLGGLFGGLFSLFIGNQEKSDKMLVAVLGIIIFSAGIASYSLVSPLLITFMVGLVLAATSHFGDQLREQLEQIEKPFYMVICFLAGLAWVPAWGCWRRAA